MITSLIAYAIAFGIAAATPGPGVAALEPLGHDK